MRSHRRSDTHLEAGSWLVSKAVVTRASPTFEAALKNVIKGIIREPKLISRSKSQFLNFKSLESILKIKLSILKTLALILTLTLTLILTENNKQKHQMRKMGAGMTG